MWTQESTYVIDETDSCEIFALNKNNVTTQNYCAWLIRGSSPIVLFHYMHIEQRNIICSVEVRANSRGYGLGRWFMTWVSQHVLTDPLYSTGQFTPEGSRSLRGAFPLDPVYSRDGFDYGSQTFVKNWDMRELRF